VDVPDLNGVWEAALKSSFSHLKTEHRIFVRIKQTWTRISVTSDMPDAVSTSVAAAVRMTDKTVELIYTFDSRSKGKGGEVMQKHSGTRMAAPFTGSDSIRRAILHRPRAKQRW
jgi:hypothetical protein